MIDLLKILKRMKASGFYLSRCEDGLWRCDIYTTEKRSFMGESYVGVRKAIALAMKGEIL